MNILINAAAFQLGWFACVLGGANQLPWLGTLVAALIVAWHLSQAPRPGREVTLLAAVGALGALWDSLLVAAGWLEYPSGTLLNNTAPHWIVAMWALFATSLNLSMGWLKGRPWLAALFGAVGGPLAYLAGERLGGLQMPDPVIALGAQAMGWAVILPLLARLATRLNGFEPVAADWARLPQEVRRYV